MPYSSTVIALTTTPRLLIDGSSANTTWANTRGASPYDPVTLYLTNLSTASAIYIGGSSSTASVGYTLAAAGTQGSALTLRIVRRDSIWAFTSAGISTSIAVMADGQ